MKDRLSIAKFERFQVMIMGNHERSNKCRICEHGLAFGPTFADDECHKCAIERKENGKDE